RRWALRAGRCRETRGSASPLSCRRLLWRVSGAMRRRRQARGACSNCSPALRSLPSSAGPFPVRRGSTCCRQRRCGRGSPNSRCAKLPGNREYREEHLSAIIRPMTQGDLPAARHILRTAFGTFLSAPDPENFWADLDYVYGRFAAEHVVSFVAEVDGE